MHQTRISIHGVTSFTARAVKLETTSCLCLLSQGPYFEDIQIFMPHHVAVALADAINAVSVSHPIQIPDKPPMPVFEPDPNARTAIDWDWEAERDTDRDAKAPQSYADEHRLGKFELLGRR